MELQEHANAPSQFTLVELDEAHSVQHGSLPTELIFDRNAKEELWELHPDEYHLINTPRGPTQTPRFQQSCVNDYAYTGSVNNAVPLPDILAPLLAWVQLHICNQLNGLLLNWYDGPSHYIGEHHDSIKGLVPGTPIVTVSFGETCTFRLSRGKGKDRKKVDLTANDGDVIVLPWETNLTWKHSVPKRTSYRGRRISVTFRAFDTDGE